MKTDIKNENLFDSKAKKILSDKQVLANILKDVVTEYKGLSFDEIYHLIEDGSDERYINGISTSDSELNNGEIKYDILFKAKLPNSSNDIGLYINVEPQGYYTSYPVVKRAIYYASRLIARQKGIEFKGQEYGSIKKVYSIWICVPSRKENRNGINKYSLAREVLYTDEGARLEDKKDYDLFDITIFNLDNQIDPKDTNALTLLKLLFAKLNLSDKDISEKLDKDYNVVYSEEGLEKGMQDGLKKGIAQGIEQGIEQGVFLGSTNYAAGISNSMLSKGYTVDQIIEILGTNEKIKNFLIKELKK